MAMLDVKTVMIKTHERPWKFDKYVCQNRRYSKSGTLCGREVGNYSQVLILELSNYYWMWQSQTFLFQTNFNQNDAMNCARGINVNRIQRDHYIITSHSRTGAGKYLFKVSTNSKTAPSTIKRQDSWVLDLRATKEWISQTWQSKSSISWKTLVHHTSSLSIKLMLEWLFGLER